MLLSSVTSRAPCNCSWRTEKPANSIPESWLPPTLPPTQSAGSFSPWKSLVMQAFPHSGKASKSRVLPVASKASWPVSTSLDSSLLPLSLCAVRQAHWPSFSFSSSSHSLLHAGPEQALLEGSLHFLFLAYFYSFFLPQV